MKIWPNGIDNSKDLLFRPNSIKFRVLLTFFRRENYTTWRSFTSTISPHMIDNFICSWPFSRQVKDCKVVNIGIRIDHTAILTSFKITAIRFKVTEEVVAHIDWKIIWYHKLTNELFNNSLSKYIADGTTYSNYNKHILEAGTNTATISNQKNKVWLHFSRNSLLPLIKERDALLCNYWTLGLEIKIIRGKATTKGFATISGWFCCTCKSSVVCSPSRKIHSMRFNTK